MQTLVSIITPVYNREKQLPKAIDSVIKQTYRNWELIIIDDRSTDNTKEAVSRYIGKDKRIKYIKNTHKQGPAGARNQGIEVAKGDYIAFLDSDDFWEEDKLEIQLREMVKKNNSFSCTANKRINCPIQVSYKIKTEDRSGDVFNQFLRNNFILTSAVMIKKEAINEVGLFDENLFTSSDFDMWLRISKKFELLFIDKQLATYVRGTEFINDATLKKTGKIPDRHKDRLRIYNKLKRIYKLNKEQVAIINKYISNHYFNKGYEARKTNKIKAFYYYLTAMRHSYSPTQMKAIAKLFTPGYYKS